MKNPVKRIALTLGEPAGIGPDIAIMLAQQKLNCEVVVFGCKALLSQRAAKLELPILLNDVNYQLPAQASGNGQLSIAHTALPSHCEAGILNPKNASWVLDSLKHAYFACIEGLCDALVTGPVHKGHLNSCDPSFLGHTEYFAKLSGTSSILMGFYGGPALVGLLTTHIPLKEVPKWITQERLKEAILLMDNALKQLFKISQPHIGVLGVNPHAGEDGKIGQEEITTILPAIRELKKQGLHLSGPLSADTAFNPTIAKSYNGLLAMYHDQGLAPLKGQSFGEIVNITLGLPIIRTSVDHGTALPLAGSRNASYRSLLAALELANKLANQSTI